MPENKPNSISSGGREIAGRNNNGARAIFIMALGSPIIELRLTRPFMSCPERSVAEMETALKLKNETFRFPRLLGFDFILYGTIVYDSGVFHISDRSPM